MFRYREPLGNGAVVEPNVGVLKRCLTLLQCLHLTSLDSGISGKIRNFLSFSPLLVVRYSLSVRLQEKSPGFHSCLRIPVVLIDDGVYRLHHSFVLLACERSCHTAISSKFYAVSPSVPTPMSVFCVFFSLERSISMP